MYAGVPGGGAETAWWHVGITREQAYHEARATLASALGIYKFFDQPAPLLIEVIRHMGASQGRFWDPTEE